MPQASDSNYAAATRHRMPFSTAGRSRIVDDDWAKHRLEVDDIELSVQEAAVAPLLEEGELDADAIVVSPTGNSAAAANTASERRRREEGWNDLGLDHFLASASRYTTVAPTPPSNESNSQPQTSATAPSAADPVS